jgi:GNAT superfamily N-acetyltransferase
MENKIGVAIPTHSYNDRSEYLMNRLLSTIESQTFKDIVVCVSDQSGDDTILNVCKKFDSKFDIKYMKNRERSSAAQNFNNVMAGTDAEIVKIIFMDDFFYKNDALEKIYYGLTQSDRSWLAAGTIHYDEQRLQFYRPHVPSFHTGKKLLMGDNTIGSPSVFAYKKERELVFDTKIRMLVDTELYYNYYKHFGPPVIVEDIILVTSTDENSVQSQLTSDLVSYNKMMAKEIKYCKDKHVKGFDSPELNLLETTNNTIEVMRIIRNDCRLFMTNNQNPISQKQQEEWFLNKPETIIPFILYEGIEPIGYAIIKIDGNDAILTGGLIESARGLGHGKKLFQMLIDKSKEMNKNPKLEVLKTNNRAIKTYKNLGFKIKDNNDFVFFMELRK